MANVLYEPYARLQSFTLLLLNLRTQQFRSADSLADSSDHRKDQIELSLGSQQGCWSLQWVSHTRVIQATIVSQATAPEETLSLPYVQLMCCLWNVVLLLEQN